jgi:hypothetical protein
VFAESFLGEKFAKVNKGKAEYESLEKRQSKDNKSRSTSKVLEAVNIVKKAEGVTGNKFVDFPAKKFCLHVRWAQGEEGVHRQAVQQLQELLAKPWYNCQPGNKSAKYTDRQSSPSSRRTGTWL